MKEQRIRRALLSTILVLLWACGDGPAETSVFVRDSAGVSIVESTAPEWTASNGWTVDTVPTLDLGAPDGGPFEEFYDVRDATRLDGGTIAVADGGSNQIRLFSATGDSLAAIGREGEGPGEFRFLSTVDRFGDDSLLAFDPRLQRLTVVSVDGNTTRMIPSRAADILLTGVLPLTDSSFVAVTTDRGVEAEDGRVSRGWKSVLRLPASEGGAIDTVASIPGDEAVGFSSGGFVGVIQPLFPKTGHVAVLRGQVVSGTADSLEYRVLSADGRVRRIVRVPGYQLAVSAAEVEEELAARLAEASDMPEMFLDGVRSLPRPSTRAAYSQLGVDAAGCVWLAQYRSTSRDREATTWEVFSESGEWLGPVHTPPGLRVYEIGTDYVLGRRSDDMDVEHVLLFRLDRR